MNDHPLPIAQRRRTDALPRDDQPFLKGAAAAVFLGTCCWAVLFVLL